MDFSPHNVDGNEGELIRFVDWASGKENDGTHGAVSRFVRAHATIRPNAGSPARWPHFDALKTHARHFGPAVTLEQIDAAVVAFRAAGG